MTMLLALFLLNEPPPNFVGSGLFGDATLAALLAAFASFIGLMISKESKISEFRQKWIDELRKDISCVLGEATMIHAQLTGSAERNPTRLMNERLTRIRLRLNLEEEDHDELLKSLTQLRIVITGEQPLEIVNEAALIVADVAAKVLKREWKVVKRGELIYRLSLWSSLVAVVGFIYLAVIHYFHLTYLLTPA